VNEHHTPPEGTERKLHDPVSDKLVPLEPLDLGKIKSVDDLVRAMGNTSFTGRQVGEGAEVVEAMARDQECFVVMTLAGAMTVAKQGLIITDLIDAGVVNAIVSTGALMAHGLVEAAGRSHFRYDPRMDDNELYDAGYNRVYDTLEPETNLDFVETIVARILKSWDHNEALCSYKLNRDIGKYLSENVPERGILKSAYEKGVPVFVPAFSDSEIGLDFALHNRARRNNNIPPLRYDPFEDLEYYAETLLKQALALQPPGPDEAQLLYMLGRTYKAWGRLDHARPIFEQVIRTYPESAFAQRAQETLVSLERVQ